VLGEYRYYQWARTFPGVGWVLVAEVNQRNWTNRLWGKR
jgi:hypothetical protein